MKLKLLIPTLLSAMALSSQAATVFHTNTNGNASALESAGADVVTPLTLSAEDGGGTINLTTISAYSGATAQTLGMSVDGMGVGNDKWGSGPQGWVFSFNQIVSFDGIGFSTSGGNGEGLKIESTAWANAIVDDTGQDWSFSSDGTSGIFSILAGNGPTFDFTSAGVASVAAGTPIIIEHNAGNGGGQMTEFTITAIPEPSTALLGGLGMLALLRRRR